MSKININPDLFLGSQELNKFQDFLGTYGYVKQAVADSLSFGIIHKDISTGNWTNFLTQQGTNAGTFKVNIGSAIDKNGNYISWPLKDNLTLPLSATWYWLKIKYQSSPIEPYLISISADGSLSAPGGSLLSILRGLPNNPVYIAFPNAVTNTQEYQVVEVIDDENAVLAGDFSAESNLQLAVVGSFTPDTVTPSDSKYPYEYDSCILTAVQESVTNIPPTLLTDEEFLVARIRITGSTAEIQDKRSLNIWRTKADCDLNTLTSSVNPLIGVEAIKYNGNLSTRDENLVFVAWGFRSSNWTFDSTANRVTLIGGQGGLFKDTSYFANGNFDGWRLYTKDGSYAIIKQSSVSALQINLILDTLDPDKFADAAQQLVVVPNADSIELIFESTTTNEIGDKRVQFPINNGLVSVPLFVYADPTALYTVKYRYISFKRFGQENLIPNDAVGYYAESQFDINGILTGSTRTPYTAGIISIALAANAYSNVISSLTTGQLFGYEYLAVDNGDPVVDITIGTNKENIIVTQETDEELNASDADFDEGGVPYVFTVDHYFNFISSVTLKNGNYFLLKFRGTYDLDGNTWKIVQDYVNPGNPGTTLYEITASDLDEIAVNNFQLLIFWDGERWQAYRQVSVRSNFLTVTGSTKYETTIISIGDWNMNSTNTVSVPHGLADFTKIRSVTAVIRNDSGSQVQVVGTDEVWIGIGFGLVSGAIDSTIIDITRKIGGVYDNTSYDSTGYNRGWITIIHEA
jgi:hypothetical protein